MRVSAPTVLVTPRSEGLAAVRSFASGACVDVSGEGSALQCVAQGGESDNLQLSWGV